MKVLVCGGREYADYGAVNRELNRHDVLTIIHGGASGADYLADLWARANAVPVEAYPAVWYVDGKLDRSAGPRRNQFMLDNGKPDMVIAFPGSRGTADMVRRAEKAGVRVLRVPPIE